MKKPQKYLLVFSTFANEGQTVKIVDRALNEKLIACATIIKDTSSIYWWKGSIMKSKEVLVIMKTEKKLFNRLIRMIKRMHSYEVPEIVALPVVDALPAYLDWIKSSLE